MSSTHFQVPGRICITPRAFALETSALLKPDSCHAIALAMLPGTPLAAAIWAICDELTCSGVGLGAAVTTTGAGAGVDADAGDLEAVASDDKVVEAVQKEVDAANEEMARVEQIKKFKVLPTDWEPGGDELTPTMKLKRKPISEKYASEIDELYAG